MVPTIEEVRREKGLTHVNYTLYRVKYTKMGNLKYISHLDLLRTMQRILLRSELPVWYSEGFNPQPKLSFGLPLSVGCESVCEYIDIRLTEPFSCEEVAARLTDAFPREMSIVSVYHPETKYNDIGCAGYTLTLRSPRVEENTPEAVKKLFGAELLMEKKSKRGMKTINLSELICRLDARVVGDALVIDTVLPASSATYVNPELLVEAMTKHLGILGNSLTEESCDLIRTEVYFADGVTVFA